MYILQNLIVTMLHLVRQATAECRSNLPSAPCLLVLSVELKPEI